MDNAQIQEKTYRKILFCTDFSKTAAAAFQFALRAAESNPGSELCLLHVIPEPDAQFWKGYIYEVGDMDAKAREDIDRKVDADYRPLVPENVRFRVEMRVGDAARGILDFARAEKVDLIVMGRHGCGVITQWLMGNVAGQVVGKSECPVLVIPRVKD